MKLSLHSTSSIARTRGISLLECLVYIGAISVVFGMGLMACFRCLENTNSVRRNSDDINQALQTGELWRADIRAATQPIRFDASAQTLHIQRNETEVTYKFADNQILRRSNTNATWLVALPHVAQSQMAADPRSHVAAWRWELELRPRREPAPIRPLFTFTAATSQP